MVTEKRVGALDRDRVLRSDGHGYHFVLLVSNAASQLMEYDIRPRGCLHHIHLTSFMDGCRLLNFTNPSMNALAADF